MILDEYEKILNTKLCHIFIIVEHWKKYSKHVQTSTLKEAVKQSKPNNVLLPVHDNIRLFPSKASSAYSDQTAQIGLCHHWTNRITKRDLTILYNIIMQGVTRILKIQILLCHLFNRMELRGLPELLLFQQIMHIECWLSAYFQLFDHIIIGTKFSS